MKGGGNRTSPRLKVLEGRADPDAVNTPKPRPLTPSRPRWLDGYARSEWRRIVPILEGLGVLTEVDGAALAGYCAAYSLWRRCHEEISKGGLLQLGHRGVERRHPLLITLRQAEMSMKAFIEAFGMTPLARSRLSLPPAPAEDECRRCGMPLNMCGCS